MERGSLGVADQSGVFICQKKCLLKSHLNIGRNRKPPCEGISIRDPPTSRGGRRDERQQKPKHNKRSEEGNREGDNERPTIVKKRSESTTKRSGGNIEDGAKTDKLRIRERHSRWTYQGDGKTHGGGGESKDSAFNCLLKLSGWNG